MARPFLDTAFVAPGVFGIRDWFDRRRERRELDHRRDALAERATDLAEAGLPDEVREHLDRADEHRDDVERYRAALDDVEEAIGRYRDLAGRHATLVERLRRARDRVDDADPPFDVPLDRFGRVLERTDPTSPTPTDLDDAERTFRNVEGILDVVEGFDYGALDRLFPVEGGAVAGAEPTGLYEAIEEPDDLSTLADALSDLASLVEELAAADVVERSRALEATELSTEGLADRLREAIRVGDVEACRRLLEETEHTERLDEEIEALREEIEELGWPTLEVDVTAILEDLDAMGEEGSLGMTRRRLRLYEDAVRAVADLNEVASSKYDVETDEVREALQEGFEETDRERVGDAAKRASDLADVVGKAEQVEAMLRERGSEALEDLAGEEPGGPVEGGGSEIVPDGAEDAVAVLNERLEEAVEQRDLPTLNRLEERLRRVEDAEWSRRDFFKFTPDGVVDLVADLWRERDRAVERRGDRSLLVEREEGPALVRVIRRESGDAALDVEAVRETAREARRADVDRGVLVTNAGFTNRVLENAEKATPPVEVVDGEELAARLTEAGIAPPL